MKQLKDQAVKTSQNCYRLATYSVVLALHLVNRLRTSSRKICVPPSVFEGLRTLNFVSSDIWPARVETFRRANIAAVGPAQRERCRSLRFPIKFRVSELRCRGNRGACCLKARHYETVQGRTRIRSRGREADQTPVLGSFTNQLRSFVFELYSA